MGNTINILLIEDNPGDAHLIDIFLKEAYGNNYTLFVCDYLHKATEQLKTNRFDIIISDLTLPDSDGLETFKKIFECSSETPIIVLTGLEDESVGINAMKFGAQDFLIKGKVKSKTLKRTINYSIERNNLLKALSEKTKKLEEKTSELHTEQKKLSEAQNLAHIGSWEWDIITNTINWSDELFRIYGLNPQSVKITLEEFSKWVHPDDKAYIDSVWQISVQTLKPFKFVHRIITADGTIRILEVQGVIQLNEQNAPVKINGTAQDITEMKQMEEQLYRAKKELEKKVEERTKELNETIVLLEKEVEQRNKYEDEIKKLSLALSKSENSIIITDNEGRIEWVSEGFVRVMGFTIDEVKGTSGEILRKGNKTGITKSDLHYKKLVKEKRSISYESRNFSKSGKEYWVLTTLTPILNTTGEVEKIIAVDSDITLRKKTEKELLLAKHIAEDSARSKELFLANMSHEIRTPMNAIMGIIQLMQDTELSTQQKQYLRSADFAADSLLRIINDILDLSKIGSGKMTFEQIEFSPADVINALVNSASYHAKEKNLLFSTDLDEKLPKCLIGDPVRLNQILANLVTNAIKFTHKGSITIKAKVVKEMKQGVQVNFEVEDTGIGIPKEKQGVIFKEFEQADATTSRRYGGTGLGLSIVKRLVALQRGKISIQSEVNKGTVFSVMLDFKYATKNEAAVISNPDTETQKILSLKGVNVLLVEDNELNQMVAGQFLKNWGVNADIVSDGKIAVEKLKGHTYDIILMDIQMPEMNGYETTRYIRNKFRGDMQKVPILAMTAHAFKDEEEKCLHAGMNGYIPKPLNRELLFNKICSILQRRI